MTGEVTIYPDQLITRRKRQHIVIAVEDQIEEYHTQLVELLTNLYDRGITEATLQGDKGAFLITWRELPNDQEPKDGKTPSTVA